MTGRGGSGVLLVERLEHDEHASPSEVVTAACWAVPELQQDGRTEQENGEESLQGGNGWVEQQRMATMQ